MGVAYVLGACCNRASFKFFHLALLEMEWFQTTETPSQGRLASNGLCSDSSLCHSLLAGLANQLCWLSWISKSSLHNVA